MSWQAPNLLDQIFAPPKMGDSNIIGNFMGGYLGGKQADKEEQAQMAKGGEKFSWLEKVGKGMSYSGIHSNPQLLQEQQQFDAILPLKQQALINDRNKNTIDWMNFTTKQSIDNNKNLGYADIGQVVAKVGEFEGGWNSPEFGKQFWAAAAKHPEVMKDPQFKSITDNFDLAQKAKYNAELATQRDVIRKQIEYENRASREEIASQRNEAMLKAKDLESQHKVRDRLGDMGYRAFLGEVGAINSNKLIPESKKRMEIRRLYAQAEQGLYQPPKPAPAETPQTALQSAAPVPNAASETVRVVSPDGKTRGTIPKSQLEEAKKQGYKLIE